MYLVLTVFLFQRGSSESRPIEPAPQDEDPRDHADDPQAPWPVRRGGGQHGAVHRHLPVLVRVIPELAEQVPCRGGIVGASVYLRQRGSPESEPVAEPHLATGA